MLESQEVGGGVDEGPFAEVCVDLKVVLGETEMAIHELLRLGRGAVVALDTTADDDVRIFADNTEIALGQLRLNGEQIEVTLTETLVRGSSYRAPSDQFIQRDASVG